MTHHHVQEGQARERRIAWDVLRNSATGRMAAALSSRLWPFQLVAAVASRGRARDEAVESDRRYFRCRSDEERRAARRAVAIKAREAHSKLAQLYAEFARGFAVPVGESRH